jgi:hypothetical protein
MNMIDSKQVMAMAEYETSRAKAKLDDAIDAEETRDELIAARTEELVVKRMAEMSLDDITAAMHRVGDDTAALLRAHMLGSQPELLAPILRGMVRAFIEYDSELMSHDWMDRMDAEVAKWGVQ